MTCVSVPRSTASGVSLQVSAASALSGTDIENWVSSTSNPQSLQTCGPQYCELCGKMLILAIKSECYV